MGGGKPFGDFISRPGQPIQQFSPNDTIIGVKDVSSLKGTTFNIHIETVQGLDPDSVAEALQEKLSFMITTWERWIKITDLLEKGVGSSLTTNEWNVLKDKLTDGTDSIFTGSVVISGTTTKVLSPLGNGSPTSWGLMGLCGSATLGAGSDVWVVFGTAFSSKPVVLLSKRASSDDFWAITGSLNTGSMYIQGTNASTVFDYFVIGDQ